jgi:uncharacterized damage-inducible protein DinB
VPRAVIHALELAQEDITAWCSDLTEELLRATVCGLPSVTFQIHHIAGSVDRLLTYAEGAQLSAEQLEALHDEMTAFTSRTRLFEDFSATLSAGVTRVQKLGANIALLEQSRAVGRKYLPTTVGGLLVHVADHTQRHVGQTIATVKIIRGQRS